MITYLTTPWANHVSESGDPINHPKAEIVHGSFSWVDVTGQPDANIQPEPNEFTVKADLSQAQVDAIDADPEYQILSVEGGTTPRPVSGTPTVPEHTALIVHYEQFMSGAEAQSIVGAVSVKTRSEIIEAVRAWYKTLPKAP